jgi:hypothetical protein
MPHGENSYCCATRLSPLSDSALEWDESAACVDCEHKTGTKLAMRVMPRSLERQGNLGLYRKKLRLLNVLRKILLRTNLCVRVCTRGYVMPRGPRGDMRPARDIGQTFPVLRHENQKACSKKLGTREHRLIAKKAAAAR